MVTKRAALGVLPLGVLIACKPDLEGRPSLVSEPRVLAIRSTPADAKPGASILYEALYVGPDDSPDPSALGWAFCVEAKPLAVSGPISPECLVSAGDTLVQLGQGASAEGSLPDQGCRQFGPTPPEAKPGEPPVRPADADTTGGYYQPVRLLVPSEPDPDYAVGVTRLSCGISGATQAQAADYNRRYRANENPRIQTLSVTRASGRSETLNLDEGAAPLEIGSNETVTLRVVWPDCPEEPACGDGICSPGETLADCQDDCQEPRGCEGSEPYTVFDPVRRELFDRRESLRVSWFATAGTFEHDRTGRPESEADVSYSENEWTAPRELGAVQLWMVIRDDRRGVGWQRASVTVGR
jgi:hypothetical protein